MHSANAGYAGATTCHARDATIRDTGIARKCALLQERMKAFQQEQG